MSALPGSSPRRGSAVPFVALCVAIIVGALVSVLLLNTTMAAGAYEARDLLIETANLLEYRADLLLDLDAEAAPQNLVESATQLGMVPASDVGYISLEDGIVTHAGGQG
jgi:hypothetical protein